MLLCATSGFSVPLWLTNFAAKLTTETQRTQRLHREISKNLIPVKRSSV